MPSSFHASILFIVKIAQLKSILVHTAVKTLLNVWLLNFEPSLLDSEFAFTVVFRYIYAPILLLPCFLPLHSLYKFFVTYILFTFYKCLKQFYTSCLAPKTTFLTPNFSDDRKLWSQSSARSMPWLSGLLLKYNRNLW